MKPQLKEFKTNLFGFYFVLALSLLIPVPAIVSTGVLENKIPWYLALLSITGAVIGLVLLVSSMVIPGVACEIMNSLCDDQQQSKISVNKLNTIVDTYQNLTQVTQSYIFLNFTTNVCAITVNLYLLTLFVSGCTPVQVINFSA